VPDTPQAWFERQAHSLRLEIMALPGPAQDVLRVGYCEYDKSKGDAGIGHSSDGRKALAFNVLEISVGLRLSMWLLRRRGATTASW